jgi:phosphohistidine phosphatase SixA
MELILVRHAKAFDRDASAFPDDSRRPLTAEGRAEFVRFAKRLGRVCRSVDLVESSGFVRAWQTAQLLHEHAGFPKPSRLERLEAVDALAVHASAFHASAADASAGDAAPSGASAATRQDAESLRLASLARAVAALRGVDRVVWVGHEPLLSRFASLLLAGSAGRMAISMKKGAALALHIADAREDAPADAPPQARLLWMLTPGVESRLRRGAKREKQRPQKEKRAKRKR